MTDERGVRSMSRSAAVLVAVVAVALAGCGNRLDEAQLRADAGIPDASAIQTGAGGELPPGAVDPGVPGVATGDVPATVPGAPSPVGAPGTTAPGGTPVTGTPGKTTTGGGSAKAPAAGGPTPQKCTGTKPTIVVGGVGQMSGPLGAAMIGGTRAAQAWVSATNAAGGLNCHPLKYVAADDGGDPARHLSLVRKLVEQDGVVAVVYQGALLTGNASADYVKSKGIPVIGTSGGEEMVYGAPNYFNAATSAAPLFRWTIAAGAKVAIPAGKTKLASIVCQEVVGCSTAAREFKSNAQRLGFQLVYEAKTSLINVDFTSQCLGAKNAGAQTVALSFDSTAIHRVAQSCASVGYFPLWVATSNQSTLDWADDKNLNGIVIGQPLLPWFLDSKPAIAEFSAAMKRYAPGVPLDASSINGWASAELFGKATKAFQADTVTSKGILDALATVKKENLGGLTYPLSFSPGKSQEPKSCGFVVQVKDGKFTSDGKLTCDN